MKDRVIVITGASAGIGAALARLVSSKGARVVLVARREEALRTVASSCAGETLVIAADVTVRADVERARDAAMARFGRIDVWVNNAGRGISRMPSELTDADLDEMFLVNVKSALYGMLAVLPHLEARGDGQVINVSSLLGRVPMATFRSAYSAAKHALNALTASTRCEVRSRAPGVHVTSVHPGIVATEFGSNALHGGVDSRTMPGAQTADEVAQVLADAIEHPRADVYTRPEAQGMIVRYYAAEDMGAAETQPPFFSARRPGA